MFVLVALLFKQIGQKTGGVGVLNLKAIIND